MVLHFVGIGGIGMSALAHVMLDRQQGIKITGSDAADGLALQTLSGRGADVRVGHDASNLSADCEAVVVSSAISVDHPERMEALRRGIPVLHRSDLLNQLMQDQLPLLVAGTHGKTTISALVTWVLHAAGWDPSHVVGGMFKGDPLRMPRHGHAGRGLYFVAEADESDGTFLKYRGFAAIISNCDRDHMDHFRDAQSLEEAFRAFAQQQPAHRLFWCADDPALRALQLHGQSYGFAEAAEWRCQDFLSTPHGIELTVHNRNHVIFGLKVPLWGAHNALNVTAAVALLVSIGLSDASIREGLMSFPGVQRRCQIECETPFTVVHDYGHHPTEIAATLAGLRSQYGSRRILVAFQPHRYSRTQDLMDQFGPSFTEADHLILTDIYAAAEKPIEGVSGMSLSAAVERTLSQVKKPIQIEYQRHEDLFDVLRQRLQPNDLLVCFGAGDIDGLARKIARYPFVADTH
jgi:UDP-N-acetylmuramate--alanine ligase